MSNAPLVSVIMSVYNGEKYLRESINSILQQTYDDFEFIIINDGSSDGSDEILSDYSLIDKRIRLIRQENLGLAQSLNNGIGIARGKFIARMDADDIALPNRLEVQSGVMLNDPRIGLCHSLFGLIDANGGTPLLRRRAGFRISTLQTRWTLIWRNCICHPSVMIRRSELIKHNLFYDASIICQDYDLWCRLIEVTIFKTVSMPLLLLRKHQSSVSSHYNEEYLSKFSSVIYRNLNKYFDYSPTPEELRILTLISGQMHLRGKKLNCRIDAKSVLRVLNRLTSKFIEKHALDRKETSEIQVVAARQLIRWSQQASYHNKGAAVRFILASLSRFLNPQHINC